VSEWPYVTFDETLIESMPVSTKYNMSFW
jgi:hypothetical protein